MMGESERVLTESVAAPGASVEAPAVSGEAPAVSGKAPARQVVRIGEIDALRGLAALAVLVMHYTTSYDQLFGHSSALWVKNPYGGLGVHLFFMISGFVIFLTIDRAGSIADFAVSRFARLYPAYWTALLITLAVTYNHRLPGHELTGTAIASNFTMFQAFLGFVHIDPVYWTLEAEMKFYILIAFLFAIGQRRRVTLVFAGLVILQLVDSYLHFTDWPGYGLWRLRVYLPFEYLYLFLAGMVFYEMLQGWRWIHGVLLGLCVTAAFSHMVPYRSAIVVVSGVLLVACTRQWLPWLACRPLVFLGTISYSLYLTHQFVGYRVIEVCYERGINGNIGILIATLISLVLATGITFLVERPANRWIRTTYQAFTRPRS